MLNYCFLRCKFLFLFLFSRFFPVIALVATKGSSVPDLPEYGPFEIKKLPRQNSIVKDSVVLSVMPTEELDNMSLNQR